MGIRCPVVGPAEIRPVSYLIGGCIGRNQLATADSDRPVSATAFTGLWPACLARVMV